MTQAGREVFVVGALRTPIGKYGGALSGVRPDDLAAEVIRRLVGDELGAHVDHVVLGATNQAGEDNRNIARMSALLAGLPYEVPAVTVNRLCGSGLEAIADGARMIALGEADCVVAGGVESMSRAPYTMPKATTAFSRQPPVVYDTSLGWRYPNPRLEARLGGLISMGETAENVAKKHGISRDDQDAFALDSQRKAAAAWDRGAFASEVVAIEVPQRKGPSVRVERDESVRIDTTSEALAKLRPVFRKDGSVTAGNSSPLNDGAAAVLLMSEAKLKATGREPLGRWVATAAAGCDPNFMGEGPIHSVRKLLQRTGLRTPNLDVVEMNEAFAAQALACQRALDLDPERVNPLGGAIALGHPIGCSGARIVVTLMHHLGACDARRGLATLCIGVGQGLAVLFERG